MYILIINPLHPDRLVLVFLLFLLGCMTFNCSFFLCRTYLKIIKKREEAQVSQSYILYRPIRAKTTIEYDI